MNYEIVAASKFSEYAQQWDQLNNTSLNQAILESRFVALLIKHFFSGDEFLVIGRDQNGIQAMLFVQKGGKGIWHTVMPSQAPLCLWVARNNDFQQLDVPALAKALPGLVLQLDFLQVDSANLVRLNSMDSAPYIETGSMDIPASFEDYFKALGKNIRQNYNKVLNRASRNGDSLESVCVTSAQEVADAMQTYAEIESASWKAEQGTAITPTNQQGLFYAELMQTYAESGDAICWMYKINGEIAAVDLCICKDGTIIILKTTFVEAFAKFSPALQMKVDLIRYYSEHPDVGISHIEYFGKAMEWHKRLGSDLRGIVHETWYTGGWFKSLKKLLKPAKAESA